MIDVRLHMFLLKNYPEKYVRLLDNEKKAIRSTGQNILLDIDLTELLDQAIFDHATDSQLFAYYDDPCEETFIEVMLT